MALIPCPECKTPVAYKAPSCPKCGELDPSRRQKKSKLLARLIGVAAVTIGVGYLWFVQIPETKQNGLFGKTEQR